MRIPFTAAERESIRKIEAIYQEVPAMQCRPGCHECCGPILMSPLEAKRLQGRQNPAHKALECPWLGKDGCRVYAMRPLICRLFGTLQDLRCPYGCAPVIGLMDASRGPELLARVQTLSESVKD